MPKAEFKKQQFGAEVAEILETGDSCLEVQRLPGGKASLTVHNTVSESGRREDMSIELSAEHFLMLGSLASKLFKEEDCPGHVASEGNSKICGRCGVHVDAMR
jgi:hypothetical protein